MNAKLFVLPALCFGGAAILLAPAREGETFVKSGGPLGENQRDARLFNNFADATANDNKQSPSQFPRYTNAELAVWKGIVEWGSTLHGDGSGDPLDGNTLGSGGANFDGFWAGTANDVGTLGSNVMSALPSCNSGWVSYTERNISTGWRTRFCDTWTWDDGPGPIGNRMDIQGLAAHEYGHALGLGHSSVQAATMRGTVIVGQTDLRSLDADDIAGIQCIYGVASVTKPVIVATVADAAAGTLTIHGARFGATDNEVWFCPAMDTVATVADPVVKVTGVTSTSGGTVITVAIPAAAGPGDVMVNTSGVGHSTVSNAFPTDLVGTFGPPGPDLTSVTPSTIDALIPGTAQTITLSGTNLDLTTTLSIDGVAVEASRWTIASPSTITLDMPQLDALGAHALGVTNGLVPDEIAVTVVAPSAPTLQWGSGDPGNAVNRFDGLDFVVAGPVGERHLVLSSNVGPPALGRFFGLAALAGGEPQLAAPGCYEIPASGWLAVHVPTLPDPTFAGSTWHAKSFAIVRPAPFAGSNDQSITLLP